MPLVPHASQGRRGVLIQTSDTLYQLLGQQHVVVAEEDHMGMHLGPPDEVRPFLDQGLACLIRRMSFARHDELHRALTIGQQAQKARRVVQQQVRSFVRRKAACKAHGQRVGIKQMLRTLNRLGRRT
jgi:hypothetical protein